MHKQEHADFVKHNIYIYMGKHVIYFHRHRKILLKYLCYIVMSHIHRIRAAVTTDQNCSITMNEIKSFFFPVRCVHHGSYLSLALFACRLSFSLCAFMSGSSSSSSALEQQLRNNNTRLITWFTSQLTLAYIA